MKKIILSILLLCGISAALTAQKRISDPNTENRNLKGFHAVEVGWGISLLLTQGEDAVAVSANDVKARQMIITEVVNGVLKIRLDNKNLRSWRGNKELRAYVAAKDLDRLHVSGGSHATVEGGFKANTMELQVSGGSHLSGSFQVSNELEIGGSGGSKLSISGRAKTLESDLSGGSELDGYGLSVEKCDIEASGGSKIFITASDEIKVESSGGSDVYYKGTAMKVSTKISGGGRINKQ